MNVLLLAQIPSHSAITTYQDVPRNYRRHIGSPYDKYDVSPNANYWETGLKEAAYRAFLRKGYADPSLKDQIINAPLIGLRNRQTTPFGDITVLARGQIYFSAGGFLFIEDENLYDCDECEDVMKQSYYNHGQMVALWTVKRLRHRDNSGFYRFETEYLISPTSNNNYLKQNGAFDYDIPGYVFVLKNSQVESNNYLQPTPAWYNEEASKYLNSKAGRRYLPPDTTTSFDFYYTTSRPFYIRNDKEWHHHYDPDIIPARNNVEKEVELYKNLLQSLKSIQTTTSTASTGYDFITRLTPTIPSSTAPPNMFTTSFRFRDATPFKPSPMYTKYSEPDPLYTTTTPMMTTRSSSQPSTRLTTIGMATKSTIPQMTSTSYSQPTTEAMAPKVPYPKPTQTTSSTTFKTTSTKYMTVKSSTPKIPTTEFKITTEAAKPEKTAHPTSSLEKISTEATYLPGIKTSTQSLLTDPTIKEFKSTQATFTPSTTPITLITAPRTSTSKIVAMPKLSSPATMLVSRISMTPEPSTKTQNIVTSTLYPLSTKPISTTQLTQGYISTNRIKSTTSMEFDIFNIFDKPKALKETKHIGNPEINKDEAKSQTLSFESSTETTPYAETNQASSVVLTLFKDDITTIQPSTPDDNGIKDIYDKPEYFSNVLPTTGYLEETLTYTLNVLEDISKNQSEASISEESLLKSKDDISTRMMPEETTTLEVTTNVVDRIPIEEATTEAFDTTTISSTEKEATTTTIILTKDMPDNNPLPFKNTTPKTLETILSEESISSETQNIETSTMPMIEIEINRNYTQTTKVYKMPRLSVSTRPTPIIYTTPRVRKYKYVKTPKWKNSKSRKFDSTSTSKPSIINILTRTSKFNNFSSHITSTTKKPEDDLTLGITTSAFQEENIKETSTMSETQITTPEATVYKTESPQITDTPPFETKITEESTQTKEIFTEMIPTSLPYDEEQTTKALIHAENSKNLVQNPAIPSQRFNIHSSEIFDEIFGIFSKEATYYTTIPSPVTKKMNKSNVNTEELEKELFGVVSRNGLEAEENHSTQIEETTSEISFPKIIFGNFYEASTSPVITEKTIEPNEETTPVTSTTLLVMESTTNKIDEDDESMVLTTIPITQNTIQPEALSNECVMKAINESMESKLEIAKIIAIQIVNTTRPDKRETYKDDILKANVSQINVGDNNFLVYKAIVDEKVLPSDLKENQTDLFNRLALSVINHAKSIDYLNRRKQQIRRKKVFKVKNRHKKKRNDKS